MLRVYQESAYNQILDALRKGLNPLLFLMVGGGKTHIFCKILKYAKSRNLRALMIVKGRKLVDQASERLTREDTPHGVAMAGHFRYRLGEPIQVASVDTLRARKLFPKADLIVLDEADQATSKSYTDILSHYTCPVLSVTATPFSPMGKLSNIVIKPTTFNELVDHGYLVAPRMFAPSMPNLKGLKKQNGEYVQAELSERMDKSNLIGDLVTHYKQIAFGRKFLGFAVSINHSKHIVQVFNDNGIACRHVDSDSTDEERNQAIEDLRLGKIMGIWNVGIFCRGVDVPFLDCMISARPTQSLALWIQMMGRFTRPYEGKKDWICLDHSSNLLKHGFLSDEHEANLTTVHKEIKIASPTTCLSCFSVFYATKCPSCGCENPVKLRKLEIKDGELVEFKAITPEMEFNRNRKAIDSMRKQKKYKLGWRWFEAKRLYGEEVAERMFPKRVLTEWQRNIVNLKKQSSENMVQTQG